MVKNQTILYNVKNNSDDLEITFQFPVNDPDDIEITFVKKPKKQEPKQGDNDSNRESKQGGDDSNQEPKQGGDDSNQKRMQGDDDSNQESKQEGDDSNQEPMEGDDDSNQKPKQGDDGDAKGANCTSHINACPPGFDNFTASLDADFEEPYDQVAINQWKMYGNNRNKWDKNKMQELKKIACLPNANDVIDDAAYKEK